MDDLGQTRDSNGRQLWLARDPLCADMLIHGCAEDSRHGISGRASDGPFSH
jgi:hypothetical protein